MGEIKSRADQVYRNSVVGGVPASGAKEPDKAEIRALFNLIDVAVYAAQAGIATVADLTGRDAFYSDAENQGKLVYVNNNNGADDDPANGVYEYVDGTARIAEGFYQGVATVVQPLVDEAETAATSAANSASGFGDAVIQPNLVTADEQTFSDTSRMTGSAIPTPDVVNGRAVGKMTRPAGAPGGFSVSIPRSDIEGVFVSASIRLVAAEAGPGTSDSTAANLFLLLQFDSGGVEIAGTRQSVHMFGSAAVSEPQTFAFAGIPIHASCTVIRISAQNNTNGLTGVSERNVWFDQMLVASGANAAYRPPLPRAGTDAEIALRTRTDRFVGLDKFDTVVSGIVEDNLSGINATLALLLSSVAFPLPDDLDWNSSLYPTTVIRQSDGRYVFATLETIARGLVDPAAWTAAPIYVDPAAGSDSNDGTSMASAVLSLAKAVDLGVATGRPYRLVLKSGATFKRNLIFQPAVHPFTYDFVVEVEGGGTATLSTHDELSWVAGTGGDAGLYSATGSTANAGTVIDLANLDADGVPVEFEKYASKAALLSAGAVNGWYYDSGATTLWVRRADGAAVTNANTRAFILGVVNFEVLDQNVNFHITGLTFMGGRTGCLHVATTGSSSFATRGCRFLYPGSAPNYTVPAWRVRNINGIAISLDDFCGGSTNDLWNIHQDAGPNKPHAIIWNAKGGKTGDPTFSTSNNSITFHENTRGIVGNPDVAPSINGSNLANVAGTHCIVFGGHIRYDEETSGATKASVELTNDAMLWLVGTRINEIIARGTSKAFLREVANDGGEQVYDSATIEAF